VSISRCLGRSKESVQVRGTVGRFVTCCFLRCVVFSYPSNSKAGGPPLVVFSTAYSIYSQLPPYSGGLLLHPQPEDAPCRGDKGPKYNFFLPKIFFLNSLCSFNDVGFCHMNYRDGFNQIVVGLIYMYTEFCMANPLICRAICLLSNRCVSVVSGCNCVSVLCARKNTLYKTCIYFSIIYQRTYKTGNIRG
jgi:hypothetical protein